MSAPLTTGTRTVHFTNDEVDEVENALVFFREVLEQRIVRCQRAEVREEAFAELAEFKRRAAVVRDALMRVHAA